MIAKNIKGKSFKGCVRYVMHEGAELLQAEGVLADTAASIIRSFAIQRCGRKEIKQPVGHIPIAFSPEDTGKMTNDFMTRLAKEYMEEMGIRNTQYIIVRHHNTDNPHVHIVYNRINNDLKLISVNNDYKRNIKTCKTLKDKYNLTYGKGKEKVRREKLHNPDKIKYKIYDTVKAVLPYSKSPAELQTLLKTFGIETEFKLKRTSGEIEGISFRHENIAFKGSEVDRKLSYGNLKKEFEKNSKQQELSQQKMEQSKEKKQTENKILVVGGIKLTSDQMKILQEGGAIYLENIQLKDGTQKSAYLFFDDKIKQPFYTTENPQSFIKYGKYEMRLMDKKRIEAGFITHAKVKWYSGDFAYPYLWKANKSDQDYQEQWGDPRETKKEKLQKKSGLPKEQKKNRGKGIR